MKITPDPVLIFFLTSAAVWINRSVCALVTLFRAPRLSNGILSGGRNKVSILVPAKNEESNIRMCVEGLLAIDYPDFEILVINDNSTDRTEEILLALGARPAGNPGTDRGASRLSYLNSPPAPAGWTGKNHALAFGAPYAQGEWLLFTDADTRHEPESLRASLGLMEKRGALMLTLLPRCLASGFWEIVLQPVAMALMGLWFPVEKVNDPEQKIYFGNGQYLLMHRSVYEKTGGHAAVKAEFLEDFALFKKAKEAGLPCAVAIGTDFFGTRMYDSFGAIWRGWRRIYLHSFERKTLPLLARASSLVLFSVIPFVWIGLMLTGFPAGGAYPQTSWALALFTAGIILATAWKAYEIIRGPRRFAWLHVLAAAIIAGILLDAARMAFTRKQTVWR